MPSDVLGRRGRRAGIGLSYVQVALARQPAAIVPASGESRVMCARSGRIGTAARCAELADMARSARQPCVTSGVSYNDVGPTIGPRFVSLVSLSACALREWGPIAILPAEQDLRLLRSELLVGQRPPFSERGKPFDFSEHPKHRLRQAAQIIANLIRWHPRTVLSFSRMARQREHQNSEREREHDGHQRNDPKNNCSHALGYRSCRTRALTAAGICARPIGATGASSLVEHLVDS
jgi:hypothetical protein